MLVARNVAAFVGTDGTTKVGRHGHRDATLILIAYRHVLRVSELISLRWDAIDLGKGFVHISRLKNGRDGTHPLLGREIRALRRLQRECPDTPHVFIQRAQDAHKGWRGARHLRSSPHA